MQEVYGRFFGPATAHGRSDRGPGFFIEAGAVQGTVYDSNSIFFERFAGWTGLLVEANPFSFAKLVVRRPATFRIETALCAKPGTLRFNLPDAQRTADGCCGRANGEGKYTLRCTPLSAVLGQIGVTHVDFWSLDVEGAELDVLHGFDWQRHTLSVLLIEVFERFRKPYGEFLYSRGLTKLADFCSPTHLNEAWYNASMITPAAASNLACSQEKPPPRRSAVPREGPSRRRGGGSGRGGGGRGGGMGGGGGGGGRGRGRTS